MLALSIMHDHTFHGGTILLNNSPPHPHMRASQVLMNQAEFSNQSRLNPQVQEQPQRPFQANCHGRYSQIPTQPQHDHHMSHDANFQRKDASHTLPYPPAWIHNGNQHQQHGKYQALSEHANRMTQNFHHNDQSEGEPLNKQNETTASFSNTHQLNDIDFEDVDEDDISDLEEEEDLRRSYELYRQQLHRPDVTSKLLIFADVISSELNKYFGRNKDQEDSCDVYEDKWATTKSGRELYYADLLRIAQGDMEPACKTVHKTSSSSSASTSSFTSSPSLSPKEDFDNRSDFKGIRDVNIGMGPLNELFEYGLKNFLIDKRSASLSTAKSKAAHGESSKRLKLSDREGNRDNPLTIPMHERNLPESFWKEPGTANTSCLDSQRFEMVQQGGMLASSRLPDFSDLVESWQGNVESMEAIHNSQRLSLPIEQSKF